LPRYSKNYFYPSISFSKKNFNPVKLKSLLTATLVGSAFVSFAQQQCNLSGTIDFSDMINGNTNQLFSVGNSVNNRMTFTGRYPDNTLADSYMYNSNANIFSLGCGNYISNTLPGSFSGLLIYNDYHTDFAAAAIGNDCVLTFTEPLCGIEFKVIDITALTLSATFPSFGNASVYQDEVVVVGEDDLGNAVYPSITKVGEGYGYMNGCNNGWNYNGTINPSGAVGVERTINTATGTSYTLGGVQNPAVLAGSTCYSGANIVSMDIQVSFPSGVFIKKLKITYRNHNSGYNNMIGRSASGSCNNNTFNNDDMSHQGIIVENMYYAGVGRGAIKGNVGEDINRDIIADKAIANVYVILYADANKDGVADNGTAVKIDSDGDGLLDNDAAVLTDNLGNYTFNNVPAGNYVIQVSQPAPYYTVTDYDNTTDIINSPADFANVSGYDNLLPVSLKAGEIDDQNNYIKRNPAVLAIDLLYFEGKYNNNNVQLTWATANEKANTKFIIEHSEDGVSFKKIGEVAGAGNSSVTKVYNFTHTQPVVYNYYRLQHVDNNGNATYSKIVTVRTVLQALITAYPNPVKNTLFVSIINSNPTEPIRLCESNGLLLQQFDSKTKQIDMSQYAAGTYLIKVGTEVKKIVKL
jgi:Secretion system C-terminal sorting domain/SdrD B-like domain